MSDLRVRNLYQDVTGEIDIMGLKPKVAIIFLVSLVFLLPMITFFFATKRLLQIGGYLMLLVYYLLLLADIGAIRKKSKTFRKDKKNASPEHFSDFDEIDVVSKDLQGNRVAFTTNRVMPWELATADQKEAAAKEWAARVTELVCHRSAQVSVFAYTHLENEGYLDRKYERALLEDESTSHFTFARVSHHSKLRNVSMDTTYINRVRKLEGFDEEYGIEELVELLPGARLGKSSILKLSEHLSPNKRLKRGKKVG